MTSSPLYPYCAPFFLFGVFLMLESLHPLAVYAVYPIKAFVVGIYLIQLGPRLSAWEVRSWKKSVGVGVLGFVIWVGLDPYLVTHSSDHGFNPYFFDQGSMAVGLIAFRLIGAVLVVPLMEELFWRGFLMRYLIRDDFENIPVGTFRWISFGVTTAAFASVHGAQWPLAVAVGLLFGFWCVRTKTMGDIVIAHAVTNFILGLYVLKTGKWYFW